MRLQKSKFSVFHVAFCRKSFIWASFNLMFNALLWIVPPVDRPANNICYSLMVVCIYLSVELHLFVFFFFLETRFSPKHESVSNIFLLLPHYVIADAHLSCASFWPTWASFYQHGQAVCVVSNYTKLTKSVTSSCMSFSHISRRVWYSWKAWFHRFCFTTKRKCYNKTTKTFHYCRSSQLQTRFCIRCFSI